LIDALSDRKHFVYSYPTGMKALNQVYNEPPDCILLSTAIDDWRQFAQQLKSDTVYGHLPLILILDEYQTTILDALGDVSFNDFVTPPYRLDELLFRVEMQMTSARRDLDANPLTRLPGNLSIMAAIDDFISSDAGFALGYVDLNNFKAFNDRYGFARGDEAIRMTARILTNVVRRIDQKTGFVGHVGGDDFLFIVHSTMVEQCCEQIIMNFDLVASTLSDDEDRIRGYYQSVDRQGNPQRFPMLSLSIAVIDSTITKITHPGKAAAIAGELKKEVKKKEGSNFLINRRAT